jgi:3D-(3,5/4)-trihydroxycyclohexane-1,2-dione acylhydrolase (decyclizing)
LATLACTSSIGPGATNMVTGAALATINRLPVLLLPSDYYASRWQGPVLQQLEHPLSADISVNDCFRPVNRFIDRISRPEQIFTALPEAMRVLTDPAETGAVTICLLQDVQTEAFDYPAQFFDEKTWHIERRLPEASQLQLAIAMLKSAERPMIIAGGGVIYSDASSELAQLSQTVGIPVGETKAGKGAHAHRTDLLLDEELLTFYDFPAEHWKHLRTTNPIESVFATVRLRHRRTKGSGSRTLAWRWSTN